MYFYPRSPCGERPQQWRGSGAGCCISIHALLAESDRGRGRAFVAVLQFLSTLSLRRATLAGRPGFCIQVHFYPRSPCGERRRKPHCAFKTTYISIHALLAESDSAVLAGALPLSHFYPRSPCGERRQVVKPWLDHKQFLSTLSLRRATVRQRPGLPAGNISIHALLAESDRLVQLQRGAEPISIHALLAESDVVAGFVNYGPADISIHALLAESDQKPTLPMRFLLAFLSTLSLRRATFLCMLKHLPFDISIHALLAESDSVRDVPIFSNTTFLSTLSLRRATMVHPHIICTPCISIHALLAESDHPRPPDGRPYKNFYPRSPCGERQ